MTVIAILGGTGALGAALAVRLAKAGHEVIIGSRDPAKARAFTDTHPALRLRPADLASGAEQCEICVIAVPYSSRAELLALVAPAVVGKIVIDATVPLRPPKVGTVQLPAAGSAAVEAQLALGPNVRVVSALQTVGAEKLASSGAIDGDVLVTADDEAAAAIVCKLLEEIGLRSWHAGPLANAAAAEAMTSLLIQINRRYKRIQSGIRITGKARDADPTAAGEVSIVSLGRPPEGADVDRWIVDALRLRGLAPEARDVIVVATPGSATILLAANTSLTLPVGASADSAGFARAQSWLTGAGLPDSGTANDRREALTGIADQAVLAVSLVAAGGTAILVRGLVPGNCFGPSPAMAVTL